MFVYIHGCMCVCVFICFKITLILLNKGDLHMVHSHFILVYLDHFVPVVEAFSI